LKGGVGGGVIGSEGEDGKEIPVLEFLRRAGVDELSLTKSDTEFDKELGAKDFGDTDGEVASSYVLWPTPMVTPCDCDRW